MGHNVFISTQNLMLCLFRIDLIFTPWLIYPEYQFYTYLPAPTHPLYTPSWADWAYLPPTPRPLDYPF